MMTQQFINATTAAIIEAMNEELDEIIQKFIAKTEAQERKFKPKLRALFDKQEKSVLSRMSRKPLPDIGKSLIQLAMAESTWVDYEIGVKVASEEAEAAADAYLESIFVPVAWQAPFERMGRPFITESFAEAGEAAMVEVEVGIGFNVADPRARKIITEKVFKFAKEVNLTTQDRLRTALIQGLDAGESIPKISQRVADVFDIARGSRTDAIARTEIVGASNHGTFEGFVQSGIVLTNIWVETKDARTRLAHTAHAGVGGEEVKLNELFSNGLRFPHDPRGSAAETINCRCAHTAGKLKEVA